MMFGVLLSAISGVVVKKEARRRSSAPLGTRGTGLEGCG